jgi:hypothetical protein
MRTSTISTLSATAEDIPTMSDVQVGLVLRSWRSAFGRAVLSLEFLVFALAERKNEKLENTMYHAAAGYKHV